MWKWTASSKLDPQNKQQQQAPVLVTNGHASLPRSVVYPQQAGYAYPQAGYYPTLPAQGVATGQPQFFYGYQTLPPGSSSTRSATSAREFAPAQAVFAPGIQNGAKPNQVNNRKHKEKKAPIVKKKEKREKQQNLKSTNSLTSPLREDSKSDRVSSISDSSHLDKPDLLAQESVTSQL